MVKYAFPRQISVTFWTKFTKTVIAGQHERVDQNALLAAAVYFFERLANYQRIEPERIAVHAAVLQSQRARLAVGDHHDLAHVFAFALQQALRKDQTVASVRVVRSDLDARELADVELFGGVVEQHAA